MMNRLLKSLVGTACALPFFMYHSPMQASTPRVCDQEYALCTSAACIPTPNSPKTAQCTCEVYNGKSVGYKSCAERKPYQDKYHTTYVISTFSFEQFATKSSMNCPAGTPWTDCVDMPCTVNPLDPKQALCTCTIHHEEAYFTFGGDCKADSCTKGFWSGATKETGTILRQALMHEVQTNNSARKCIISNKK